MDVNEDSNIQVIFDTDAILAISSNREDFVGEITRPKNELRLGGMSNGLRIEGIGIVQWTLFATDGREFVSRTQYYYFPQAKVLLISSQRLFKESVGVSGGYWIGEHDSRLDFEGNPSRRIEYDSACHLPTSYGRNEVTHAPQVNLCVTDDKNENITPLMNSCFFENTVSEIARWSQCGKFFG